MKKILFSSILMASAFAVLGGMNAFDKIDNRHGNNKIGHEILSNYSTKYRDCILENDLPKDVLFEVAKESTKENLNIEKVNSSIKKYGRSMDSTIKSLNAIDAHDFIHKEFERSKNIVLNNDLTDIRKYYHLEIMRICYDSDRSLNLGSEGRL